ncbi:MAG: PEP-CTERM sorting domain-containing protein [Chthoniobacterales bacterium]
MKETSLITAIICGMMVSGTAFSQHTQSISFTPSGTVFNQNDTFTVDTTLTNSGYSSWAFAYWLETAAASRTFFHITAETFLTFIYPNQPGWPNEFSFPMTNGVDNGYYATSNDLGGSWADLDATAQPLAAIPPGTYQVSHITFSITGATPGVYTFYSTSTDPRPSIVVDGDFNSNAIPRASFTITVVPEPSTFALLALTGAGAGLLAYRRWCATR